METKILNALNGLLEENLEMEELEKRVEMMIVSPDVISGGTFEACYTKDCDRFACNKD